jgi:hypothetical protein
MNNFDWVQFFFPYRRHLEIELIQQKSDFQERLREKNLQIMQLETELKTTRGKLDRIELVLMPLSSAAGAAVARAGQSSPAPPKFEPPVTGWQNELKKFMEDTERAEKEAKETVNVQK